ncbi:MAG: hypothetical protein A2Z96_02065 [Spirochaetes bacterium GWB1_48_6]|nr:MAG: hypothetical protein A2Z96_02065 [Spirochaetes bacterium GWB1_48_6]
MQRYLLPVLLFSLSLHVTAQEWTVTLRWDPQALPLLEGKLFIPQQEGTLIPQEPRETKVTELLGEMTWTTSALPPGRTRFYVINKERDDEFADWAGYRWLDMVEVRVTGPEVSRKFLAPLGSGALWYVFDILGEDNFLQPTMQILPRRQSIYGHITDASTGVPIKNVTVEVINPTTGEILGKDTTSSSGLYLFFLSEGAYTLRTSSRDYISIDESINTLGFDFPKRRDFNLSRELQEQQLRIVLSWDYYPENLDLIWEHEKKPVSSTGQDNSNLKWEFTGSRAFSNESLLVEGPNLSLSRLSVEANPLSNSLFLMGYSQVRVRVYKKDGVILNLTVPSGSGNKWEIFEVDTDLKVNLLHRLGTITPLEK